MAKESEISINENNEILEGGCCLGGSAGMVAGGITLPIIGFVKAGFIWGLAASVPAAAVGAIGGGIIGAGAGFALGARACSGNDKLDRKALQNKTPYVTIAYNRDHTKCILRPDYADGHVFNLTTRDKLAKSIKLYYTPQEERKFAFEVGIENNFLLHMDQTKYEIAVQTAIGGIPMIRAKTGTSKGLERFMARASLYSDTVGPDEIGQISTAATDLLQTTKQYLEECRRASSY